MKNVLIVYYTRSGHTEKVANKLATDLNADVEKIVDLKSRKGILGFITGGRDAKLKKLTSIDRIKHNPKDYELVILATPTWASTLTPALRTYMEEHKVEFKKVAFMVSQGGGCNGKIYKDLEALTEKPPIATVDFSRSELQSDKWLEKLKTFVESLNI